MRRIWWQPEGMWTEICKWSKRGSCRTVVGIKLGTYRLLKANNQMLILDAPEQGFTEVSCGALFQLPPGNI